ncbi:MAG TPA: UvrD-helicase domain-containing protein [Vulgatibacter sp.]|nr:UvrD-helicase domain-containing protein [Vulgatibacter sp.]
MRLRHPKPEILREIPKDRHAVIEASAGTGKTYTLEHLVVDLLLTTDVTIANILVVTFTERATGELRQRVRSILQHLLDLREETPGAPDLPDEACWILDDAARARLERALRQFDTATISTIHGFCRRILTEHAFANQRLFAEKNVDGREAFEVAFLDVVRDTLAVDPTLRPLFERWLSKRSLSALEDLLYEAMRERAELRPFFDGDASQDLAAIDEGRAALEALAVQRFLPVVRERLARRKREQGLFDFDDMLTLVRENLRGAHGEALARILRGRYAYALIDEFQDTDEVQWEIFRRIFFESGGANRLYLIGDPKQAIYRFRGADVETYLEAKREILEAGGARVALRANFRSTSGLIDGYNRILDQRADPPFFTSGGIDYREPVSSGKPELRLVDAEGRDAAPVHVFEMHLGRSGNGGVRKGQDYVLPPLGARIAREIRAITDPVAPALRFCDGESPEPGRIDHRDIYILCRNSSEGVQIGRQLRAVGVPHAFYKQDGLLQTPEAVALHDLLAAIADPDDRSKRLRAFLSPFFELRLRDLPQVLELPGTDPLMEKLASWKRDADERRFERLFSRILDESGLIRRLILSDRGDRELTNYLHLVELLHEAVGASCRTLPELVRLLDRWIRKETKPENEEGNQQRLESDRNAVQIMTMHASKGLEAKVVFLAGGLTASRGRTVAKELQITSFHGAEGERLAWIGDAPAEVKEQAKQEERWEDQRLLYVALTRAKARLYLPMYFGPDGAGGVVDGCYRAVDERLHALDRDPGLEAAGFGREAIPMSPPEERGNHATALEGWEPSAAVLDAGADRAKEAAVLVEGRRGNRITSYTQMKSGAPAAAEPDPDRDDFAADRGRAPPLPPDELPGGAATGIFLHEVLAKVEPGLVCGAGSPEALRAIPKVENLLRTEAARGGIEPGHLDHAARLVHLALTSRTDLHGGRTLAGIGTAPRLLREMEFLFPIPEAAHPRLGEGPPTSALQIRRGFVKGFVDFLFEHEGLAYFGDWKSDVLPRYDAPALAERTEAAYGLQARLYSIAMVKMLGIRGEADFEARFGGFLYVYLRGLRPGGDGIHIERPTWARILSWEAELLERNDLEGAA